MDWTDEPPLVGKKGGKRSLLKNADPPAADTYYAMRKNQNGLWLVHSVAISPGGGGITYNANVTPPDLMCITFQKLIRIFEHEHTK